MLNFLFRAYASSFYGAETWFPFKSLRVFHKTSVAYHKAIKKITGHNVWDSNHDACDSGGFLLFRHMLAKRLLSFFSKMCSANGPCLRKFSFFMRYCSKLRTFIEDLFSRVYEVKIFCNELAALYSRVEFVHRTEERSNYVATVAKFFFSFLYHMFFVSRVFSVCISLFVLFICNLVTK